MTVSSSLAWCSRIDSACVRLEGRAIVERQDLAIFQATSSFPQELPPYAQGWSRNDERRFHEKKSPRLIIWVAMEAFRTFTRLLRNDGSGSQRYRYPSKHRHR
jgi:hypothetical protein